MVRYKEYYKMLYKVTDKESDNYGFITIGDEEDIKSLANSYSEHLVPSLEDSIDFLNKLQFYVEEM